MGLQDLSLSSLLKLMSFLFWSWLYLNSALSFPEKAPEWSSRLVTLLHGSVATIVGMSQCGIMSLSARRLNMKVSTRQYALMLWSWGYFTFDLLWCLVYQPEGRLMLCHHASAVIAITLYMKKTYTGCTFACNLAMLELTNPLLQTRWFLKNGGYDKSSIFFIIETTYLILFLAVRGVFGTYLLYKVISSTMFDLDEKIISLVFYLVSIGLIYDVMGYVLHRYQAQIIDTFKFVGLHNFISLTWDSNLNHPG